MAWKPWTILALVTTSLVPLAHAQDSVAPSPAPSTAEVQPSLPALPGESDNVIPQLDPFADRGSGLPVSIIEFQKEGAELISLGEVGGVKGYLAQGANGGRNVFYALPDGQSIAAGTMFDAQGLNVTSRQLGRMMERFSDAATASNVGTVPKPELPATDPVPTGAFLDRYRNPDFTITPLGAREGGVDAFYVQAVKANADGRRPSQVFYVMPDPAYAVAGVMIRKKLLVTGLQLHDLRQKMALVKATAEKGGSDVAADAVNKPTVPDAAFPTMPELPVVPADAPATTPIPSVETSAPVEPEPSASAVAPVPAASSGDQSTANQHASTYRSVGINAPQLTDALKATAFFTVGEREAPPVYIVVDPQCPFCHRAWQILAPKVAAREIQLRVIMIAGLRGSEELARSILSREDPGKAWLEGEGSVSGVRIKDGPLPNSKEWIDAGKWLEMNSLFAKRFDIRQTPFIVYVGKDQEVYFSLGLPESMDEFLTAV